MRSFLQKSYSDDSIVVLNGAIPINTLSSSQSTEYYALALK